MSKLFMKGSEVIAEAAVRAGCRFFAGYPITPQNEIPEYFSRRMPQVGGTFIQGESEIASVNMVFGAASAGARAMTSSSSCGISLKSEGISYMAGARVPAVICSVMRGGPGCGAIQPAQQDYLQTVKAQGNGGFHTLVLAPSTIQEAADLTYEAFDYADRYNNPVTVLIDGVISTMMEPVELPPQRTDEELERIKEEKSSWALTGKQGRDKKHLITSGNGEEMNVDAAAMYEEWKNKEVRVEKYRVEDAKIVVASYGISARICREVIDKLRGEGIAVGMIRPITVYPFPYKAFDELDYNQVEAILDVEMSIPAQMVEDVELGVCRRAPIHTCLSSGGRILGTEEVEQAIRKLAEGGTNA